MIPCRAKRPLHNFRKLRRGPANGHRAEVISISNIQSAVIGAAKDVRLQAHPDVSSEIASGQFGTLHGWLTDNIYRHGRALTPNEIVTRATGSPMTMAPYLAYLRRKYSELYQLPQS